MLSRYEENTSGNSNYAFLKMRTINVLIKSYIDLMAITIKENVDMGVNRESSKMSYAGKNVDNQNMRSIIENEVSANQDKNIEYSSNSRNTREASVEESINELCKSVGIDEWVNSLEKTGYKPLQNVRRILCGTVRRTGTEAGNYESSL